MLITIVYIKVTHIFLIIGVTQIFYCELNLSYLDKID